MLLEFDIYIITKILFLISDKTIILYLFVDICEQKLKNKSESF